uniref:AA_permease domain-containing protein n=1 Tax=Panagrellus redivivus TaxID=6233 RepID=A0A7E4V844_PANRE
MVGVEVPPEYEEEEIPRQTETLTRFRSLPVIVEDQVESEYESMRRNSKRVSIFSDRNSFEVLPSDLDYLTLDKPPNIDYYRLTIQNARPSMPELMHGIASRRNASETSRHPSTDSRDPKSGKDLEAHVEEYLPDKSKIPEAKKYLSWFSGVYVAAFTNIVGTLLYQRMGYVAGQAGIIQGIIIVLFSSLVIGITALSLTGICSNGVQKRGGLYYVVSRALGPQLGGSIGVIFSIANVGMAAQYIIGIAEFLSDLLREAGFDYITFDRVHDNRVFSIAICTILMLIAFAGPGLASNLTMFFFSTYFVSYFNWIIGTFMPISTKQAIRGLTGYSWKTTEANLWSAYRGNEDVTTVFAVFFPGFTGMLACMMGVDNLKNPGQDVWKGLSTCILTTTIMYIIGVIVAGATVIRDANGMDFPTIDPNTSSWAEPDCVQDFSCKYGLMNYYQIADLQSAWRPLLILGMLGMTISSTMTNLDQGPLTFQAACKDALFPYMKYFAKEYGPNKEPRRAYVFFAILTMGLCLVGDLNAVNEIVTNLFMVTYALVNYACFDASLVKTPGWRPAFKYYNMYVSLAGAILCIVIMFVISLAHSIFICVIFALTLAYFHYHHPDVNWGDTGQAHTYRNALHSLQKLTNTEIHVKNYRPQILLMIGNPASRVPLLDFANNITKGDSLLIAAHVLHHPANEHFLAMKSRMTTCLEHWLKMNKLKAFYSSVASESLRSGALSFLQTAGIGRIRPNLLLIGFKRDWKTVPRDKVSEIEEYVGILRDAFESNYGVGVLRNSDDGFDHSEELLDLKEGDLDVLKRSDVSHDPDESKLFRALMQVRRDGGDKSLGPLKQHKFYSDRWMFTEAPPKIKNPNNSSIRRKASSPLTRSFNSRTSSTAKIVPKASLAPTKSNEPDRAELSLADDNMNEDRELKLLNIQHNLAFELNRFHRPLRQARIDVWWLYDDGGLTLLIPHLLRLPKSYLEGADLRIFTLASSQGMVEAADEANMIAMLQKFRIAFKNVQVIRDMSTKPMNATITNFEKMIAPWKAKHGESAHGLITENDLHAQRQRTMRQLRTHELLRLHSKSSQLIVITLPIPREGMNACLYMAWIDFMTASLPPTLLIRGNQTSVLSFYA